MGKKKITIAAGANPFDKSKSAAESMFAPQAPAGTENIDTVGHVEQQNQHIQHIQYIQHEESNNNEEKTAKKGPRQFHGKQHIHLILPDRQADMIKQLAKISGLSVNQFMSQTVDQLYEDRWKPVVEALEQNRHKLGLDKKTDKTLFG